MKKIIAVTGLRGIPHIMGGVETHCEELYPRISDKFDVRIYARSPYVSNKSNYKNIQIIPVWTIANKYLETILHTLLCILKIAIFQRPDIVHIHAIGPALLTPLARLLGLKVIVTHHGEDYQRKKWGFFAKNSLRLGEFLALVFANRLIVVGKSLSENLQDRYPKFAHKIMYIPNGCPVTANTSDRIVIQNDSDFGEYILAVGRLVPEKGFHDLIQAYTKANLKHIKLIIIGAADHEDKYSENLKRFASDKVKFLGRRERSDVMLMLDKASLFVLPSYHEGLPISALEAISRGTRCLLSNIPANTDIGLDASCYFQVGDVSMLADKLANLENIALPNRGLLTKYQWASISDQYTKLVCELIH